MCAHQVVQRLTIPRAVAGHPALELCNTFAGWDGLGQREYLETYDHLVVVAETQGLLEPASSKRLRRLGRVQPAGSARVLGAALRFRADLYRCLTGPGEHGALEAMTRSVRRTASVRQLVEISPGGARWTFDDDELRLPLHNFVWAAQELLSGPDLAGVRQCPGRDCGWLFHDSSGRRRWCIMALCGNRAKARRFQERQRPAPPAGRSSRGADRG